jgi:hypothetical protein
MGKLTEINLFQSAVIPASFGECEIQIKGDGANAVVLILWKKGCL